MLGDSQSFSQGLTAGLASQSSPQKKTRQEDALSCLPTTVHTVQAAIAECGNADLTIHGAEVSMILLVGTVESYLEQTASLEFTLNDTTGRIKVRQYLTDAKTGSQISTGQHVCLIGSVRSMPEAHVSAQFLTVVEASQLDYHMVEAAHAYLKLTRGRSEPPFATPERPGRPIATPQMIASPQVATLMEGVEPQKTMQQPENQSADALRAAIAAYLRDANQEKGVDLTTIAKQMEPATSASVRNCLDLLVADGEIYNTIDDEHYSAL